MKRDTMLAQTLDRREPWDVIIIGGGATGVGCAIDAASRGYATLLLEQSDFGKATSSRSTKLVHGGVRYLEQGNVSLVMEALKERGLLRQNAPHLVHDLAFVVPNYDWWEAPFYGLGLKVYNLLAGKYNFGSSRILSREETLERLPTISTDGLLGGVVYYDGQFDDARLLIHMVRTAHEQGATLLNYAPVTGLTRDGDGFVDGVTARDAESASGGASGREFTAKAHVVINATGIFSDSIRRMADPTITPMIAPGQGVHLVFDKSFLPGDAAIMVPHTSDGRVLFAIPWHEHTLVGTTDTAVTSTPLDPLPLAQEIEFILGTAGLYLHHKPTRGDVLSAFAGIRPLVKAGNGKNTAALSRDHHIQIDGSGLITIAGGKWTTYRRMAEDCVNHAAELGHLPERECRTKTLNIHGHDANAERFGHLWVHGSDAPAIQELARRDRSLAERLHPALPYLAAEVVWAARHEMARTVDDVLARRTRALFLNAAAAMTMAPRVAVLMAGELKRDAPWVKLQMQDFARIARGYRVT